MRTSQSLSDPVANSSVTINHYLGMVKAPIHPSEVKYDSFRPPRDMAATTACRDMVPTYGSLRR